MSTIDGRIIDVLAEWIPARLAADGTPGLSLAITDRDGIVHTAAFGLANIDANLPVTTAHLFETGSIGKSFTAIALLQLADEGKVDLQAPVTDYLPWFSIQSAFEPIRLHHLLPHTAGITSGLDFAPANTIQVWALRDAVATTPPGTYFHYSNIGYKVLGEVLQAVTGESYGPTIQKRILDPLGLVDSVPTITHDTRSRLAVGYGPWYDDRLWWPGRPLAPATWLETDTADGCLAMTAADLASYLRMLHNEGDGPHGRVLSEEGFGRFTQHAIHIGDESGDFWYGYGIVTGTEDGHRVIEHGGGMVGYFASMAGDVDLGYGAVALINGPGSPGAYTTAALKLLRASEEGKPLEGPEITDPRTVKNAADFAGTYRMVCSTSVDGRPAEVIATANGDRLKFRAGDETFGLLPYADDVFATADGGLDRFALVFTREEDAVTGFTHGDALYVKEGAETPSFEPAPEEWKAYEGHYRSHNPWTTDFRVVQNKGRLWLIISSEPDGLETQQSLFPVGDGWFRCGVDERIPERVRFDVVIDGRAQRANLGLCEFYRVLTP